jgi:hypothetical protein
VKKRSAETLLRDTKVELAVGDVLLAEKKKAARKAKTKLARNNAKRSAAIVEETIANF